jgi:AmmeMemoRadiSam system protein B
LLPEGWYPAVGREVETKLGAWDRVDAASQAENALACIGPHAGWYFSGRIAWAAWRSAADSDAVVIIGGHLPAGSGFRFSPEDGFETPLGTMVTDTALRDAVALAVSAVADKGADNTVEVHLPMAAHRFPGIPVACFRAPNDAHAAQLGLAIAGHAESTGKKIFVFGSTDLTHYGSAYGFEPAGHGPEGFPWARRADKAIVEAFVAMDAEAALKRAQADGSACSVGAAIAALVYARHMNAVRPRLLMRGSSDEIAPGGDSSVGYCAVAFMR